jgi:cobalamin biosynthesis protein CobT
MSRIRTTLPLAAVTVASLLSAAPALAADRDRDGMDDRWEKSNHVTKARFDADRDGLTNVGEFRSSTNPRKADTDRDRIRDGAEDPDRDRLNNAAEQRLGTDPRNPDTDGDGTRDGREHVGAVASFADGTLTLTLADGRTVTARVTDETDIECETAEEYADGNPKASAARRDERDGDNNDEDDGERNQREDNAGDGSADVPSAATQHATDDENDDGEAGDVDLGGCTPEELDGAGVREAELELTDEGFVLTELELVVKR